LESYVSSTLHHPLPAGQPLWEVHLIEGYNGSGSALISRIHHCIADGIALTRVMMSLTDDPNEAALADVDDARRKISAVAHCLRWSIWAERLVGDVVHPSRALDLAHDSHPPGARW